MHNKQRKDKKEKAKEKEKEKKGKGRKGVRRKIEIKDSKSWNPANNKIIQKHGKDGKIIIIRIK